MNLNYNHITDDLLVKYLLGEATGEERLAIEAWISDNAANRKQYEDFKTIWEQSKQLAAISSIDTDMAWQKFKARVAQPNPKAAVRQMRPLGWLRIAALVVLIVGACISYQFFRETPVKNIVVASHQGAINDTLPDGSIVTLNKNSELDYPSRFKGDTRSVSMKGEAFFTVSPNRKKPFVIHANDVTIRVVGTSFNVRTGNDITEVIVETGIVQVMHHDKIVELRPGEKVKLHSQDSILKKDKVEDKLYNYYRSKQFVCDNTPLWKFVEVLNEAYDSTILIEDPKLRSLPLTATFNNLSLDRILEVIHETFNITVTKEKDRIILR